MLTDPDLRSFAADQANWRSVFAYFAQLTVKHAARYARDDNVDVVGVVRQAWQAVGVDPRDFTKTRDSKKQTKKLWDSDCAVL